jgi:hypothetical protein
MAANAEAMASRSVPAEPTVRTDAFVASPRRLGTTPVPVVSWAFSWDISRISISAPITWRKESKSARTSSLTRV